MEAYQFAVTTSGGATSTYRYTDAPLPLVHGGNTWTPFPWVRSGFNRMAPQNALRMTCPSLPFEVNQADKVTVQIYKVADIIVGSGTLTANVVEAFAFGELVGYENTDNSTTMEFSIGLNPGRLVATRAFTKKCPFVFGGSECGVNIDDFASSTMINERTDDGSWLSSYSWNNIPRSVWENLYARGDAFRPGIGSRITHGSYTGYIVDTAFSAPFSGGVGVDERWVKVHPPLPDNLVPPTLVDVAPTCNKEWRTCASQFSNGENFGGWLHVNRINE